MTNSYSLSREQPGIIPAVSKSTTQSTQTTPEIIARVKGNLAYWDCKYCKTTHIHGATEGYRRSHCTSKQSPYYNEVYYLRLKKHCSECGIELSDNEKELCEDCNLPERSAIQ